jgi:hypothetical protein
VTLNGNNIVENNACGGTPISADPALGPLTDNGGLTPTMLPADGSLVIDAGAVAPRPPISAASRAHKATPAIWARWKWSCRSL